MIVKNPEYVYEVSRVSSGGKDDKTWTRFSIKDYDKKQKRNTFLTVLVFGDFNVQDGDKVSFADYQVGANQYQGRTQVTLFVSDTDITVATMAQNEAVMDVDTSDLPW